MTAPRLASLLRRIPLLVWIGWGAGSLVVIVAATSTIYSWRTTQRIRQEVEAELARLDAEGAPTTPEAIAELHRLPKGAKDNSTDWLLGETLIDTTHFENDDELPEERPPAPGAPWPGLPATETFLAGNRQALTAFHRAAQGGGQAHFPVDFALGEGMLLPQLSALRQAAWLLEWEAYACAHRGDASGAARSLHAIFMAALAVEHEPILVSQLTCVTIQSTALTAIADLLPTVDFSNADLEMFQADLRRYDFKAALRLGLIGERVTGLHEFRHSPGSPYANTPRAEGAITRWADCQTYVRWMDRCVEALDLSWAAACEETAAVDREVQALEEAGGAARSQNLLTLTCFPAVDFVFERFASAQTLNRAADAAIAAARYRAATGALPERLDQLVGEYLPQVPLDPFTDEPLMYLGDSGGIVVYGVGRDGRDDYAEERENWKGDVGFALPMH